MFRTFTCPSSGVLIYRLFHCRMWCYAIGVVAVVLRSWCVVMCTVCQLVSENKIIVTLFASSWYVSLLIHMVHGHTYIKIEIGLHCYSSWSDSSRRVVRTIALFKDHPWGQI